MKTEEEIEDLEKLSIAAGIFTSEVFDWVSCLKQNDLLTKLYDLQLAIHERIKTLNQAKEETIVESEPYDKDKAEAALQARNDALAKQLKENYTDEDRNKIIEDNYRGAD